MLDGNKATSSTAAMVLAMIPNRLRRLNVRHRFTRVASQESVPHQDVALVISLLSLWSKIGSAIGSAIVAVIWSDQMPKHLPATATEKDVEKLFGSLTSIRKLYYFDDPKRVGAILAYRRALCIVWHLCWVLHLFRLLRLSFRLIISWGSRRMMLLMLGMMACLFRRRI